MLLLSISSFTVEDSVFSRHFEITSVPAINKQAHAGVLCLLSFSRYFESSRWATWACYQ